MAVTAVVATVWRDVSSQPTTAPNLAAGPPLREVAARRGIALGTAVDGGRLRSDPAYAAQAATEFSSLTPENELKWLATQPRRGQFDFRPADAIFSAAEGAEQQVRGHTLVWHRSLPDWVERIEGRDALLAVLREHIGTVVGRYRGRVRQWDVVNEPLDDNGGLRDSIWRREIGDDYLDYAFRFAREADPDALLFVNEYGAETSKDRADGLVRLVRDLRKRGVPVGGAGLEAHLSTRTGSGARLPETLRRLEALGVETAVTELDVRVEDKGGDLDDQARVYGRAASACRERPSCRTLAVWGFTDRSSWVSERFPGWGRATLTDDQGRPKPATQAMKTALS